MNSIKTLHGAFSCVGIHAYRLERSPCDTSGDVGRRRKEFDDEFLSDELPPLHSTVVPFTFGICEGSIDIFERIERWGNGQSVPVNLLGLVHFFAAHTKTSHTSSWRLPVYTFLRSAVTGRMWQFSLNGPYLTTTEYSGSIEAEGRTILVPMISP